MTLMEGNVGQSVSLPIWSSSKIYQQLFYISRFYIKCGTIIHVTHGMNSYHFGDPLGFYVAPSAMQNFSL